MATKPMGIIKRIKKYLAEWYTVILKKDSDGVHPKSFSRVTWIDGDTVLRTAFEATSPDGTYDLRVGRYSVEHLEENDRINFFWTGLPLSKESSRSLSESQVDDDDDDDYDDRDDEDEDEDEDWDYEPVRYPYPCDCEDCRANSQPSEEPVFKGFSSRPPKKSRLRVVKL